MADAEVGRHRPQALRPGQRADERFVDGMEQMGVGDYPAFLAMRRQLMAHKIRAYFATL